jgi:hypothetical protein
MNEQVTPHPCSSHASNNNNNNNNNCLSFLSQAHLISSQPYYLQTLDERGLLSTYICPCPSVEIQVVVVAGPAGVLAEEPRLYQIDGTKSVDCE